MNPSTGEVRQFGSMEEARAAGFTVALDKETGERLMREQSRSRTVTMAMAAALAGLGLVPGPDYERELNVSLKHPAAPWRQPDPPRRVRNVADPGDAAAATPPGLTRQARRRLRLEEQRRRTG